MKNLGTVIRRRVANAALWQTIVSSTVAASRQRCSSEHLRSEVLARCNRQGLKQLSEGVWQVYGLPRMALVAREGTGRQESYD